MDSDHEVSKRATRKREPLTVQQVLDAHAEFGQLDRSLTRKAMGRNWPESWNNSAMFTD